jgi:hypothetical protein
MPAILYDVAGLQSKKMDAEVERAICQSGWRELTAAA